MLLLVQKGKNENLKLYFNNLYQLLSWYQPFKSTTSRIYKCHIKLWRMDLKKSCKFEPIRLQNDPCTDQSMELLEKMFPVEKRICYLLCESHLIFWLKNVATCWNRKLDFLTSWTCLSLLLSYSSLFLSLSFSLSLSLTHRQYL